MKKTYFFICFSVCVGILLFPSCNEKKTINKDKVAPTDTNAAAIVIKDIMNLRLSPEKKTINKDELIGIYKIDKVVLVDTTTATTLVKNVTNWTLSLEKNDNFEFKGGSKTIVGYWAFAEDSEPKNSLLFQSGYMREGVVYAQFDETNLLFKGQLSMFDSAFQQVLLKRVDKK